MRRQRSNIAAAWFLTLVTTLSHHVACAGQSPGSELSHEDENSSPSRNALRGRRLGEDLAQNRTEHVYDDIGQDSGIPIIKFPLSDSSEGQGKGFGEKVQNSVPECQLMQMDFSKASNGRILGGGSFVGDEWYRSYGVKVSAYGHGGEKHDDVHPMIFDSVNVESNGLNRTDMYFLGSPNFECGGFGVGSGGRVGKLGENCQPLGNLLIPSTIHGSHTLQKKGNGARAGGVLVFDFYKKTNIEKIALLNVGEDDGSEIEVIHNGGNSETTELHSVGINGYQSVSLELDNVEKLKVSFESFTGIASLDLCVESGSMNRE